MKKRRSLIVFTVVNIMLFLMSLYCLIKTTQNNKIFNSIDTEFDYEECGYSKVILSLEKGKKVTLVFGNNSVKVVDSYQATSKRDSISVMMFIRYYAEKRGYVVLRSNTQIMGEYRLHNILYTFGYKKEQTSDADIEFVKDRRWYVNMVSSVCGWIGI